MHILIYSDKGTHTARYREKLMSWGHTVEEKDCPELRWKDQELDPVWLRAFCEKLHEERNAYIDAIQFITKDWKRPLGMVGVHYHYPYSGYQVGAIRIRKGWENTALHEFMHTLDDVVRIYLGVSLAFIAKVADWDEDVVHGRDPRFEEYEYDEPWEMVKLTVKAAVLKRKKLTALSLMTRLLVRYRQLLAELQAKTETIVSMNTLQAIAVSALNTDASPRDIAPDELGCAETVSNLIRQAIPTFPLVTGTWTLWDNLRKHPNIKETRGHVEPGDIIISPTVPGKPFPGHAGIVGENGTIMSNDSRTGLFKANYTLDTWHDRYAVKGLYPVYYFRIKS